MRRRDTETRHDGRRGTNDGITVRGLVTIVIIESLACAAWLVALAMAGGI